MGYHIIEDLNGNRIVNSYLLGYFLTIYGYLLLLLL